MRTKKKAFYKTLLFWELLIGGLVILGIVIFIAVELGKPVPDVSKPDDEVYENVEDQKQEEQQKPSLLEANPIGLSDFRMEGDYLSCTTAPSVLGIDVSTWQTNVDWQRVKDAGVEFVIIRAGFRGSESGDIEEDDYAWSHYEGATAVGLKVGAYFFSQAISVEEAIEEARFLLDTVEDWQIDMPVVFDWEYISPNARTGKVDARTLTDCSKAFCDVIKSAGYTPMVYFNTDHSYNGLHLEELRDYQFWLAQYNTVLNYPYKIDMWQYTETGSVPGISGDVDINLYFPWDDGEKVFGDNAS